MWIVYYFMGYVVYKMAGIEIAVILLLSAIAANVDDYFEEKKRR